MPQRSAISQLPEEIRQEFEKCLIQRNFAGYQGFEDWFAEKGYEISKSSAHRYGQQLERRLQSIKISTESAKAIANASPDDEGVMGDALTRLMQDKVFNLLVELEDIDPDRVDVPKLGRMIADLNRSSVIQKKWQAEARGKAARAVENIEEKTKTLKKSLDPGTLRIIREEVYGIV